MKSSKLPAQEYLKECFDYTPETGQLKWKIRPSYHFKNAHGQNIFNTKFAGKVAGSVTHKGYVVIKVGALSFKAHRIIWKILYNCDPDVIDHKDQDRSNNRINNLRNCSPQENRQNSKTPVHNTSGRKGVSYHKHLRVWQARIRISGRLKHLGSYACPTAAYLAYCKAARRIFGEFANLG